jgi:hypothetical protein
LAGSCWHIESMSSNAQYRDAYRREHVGLHYSGKAHFVFVLLFSLGGIALCIWQIEAVRPLEWLTVPLAFLYANLVEYAGHRWVMHRKVPGLLAQSGNVPFPQS